MRLWAIYYIAGHVAATVGPWPYNSSAACEQGRQEQVERFETLWKQRGPDDPLWTVHGKHLSHDDFDFVCEFREERPKLGTAK